MGTGASVSHELAAPSFKTDGSPSRAAAFVNAPMPDMMPAGTRHDDPASSSVHGKFCAVLARPCTIYPRGHSRLCWQTHGLPV